MRRILASAVLMAVGLSVSAYADDARFSLADLRDDAHKGQQRTPVDEAGIPLGPVSDKPCVDGLAGDTKFACDGIDLLSFTPSADFGGSDPDGVDALGGGNSDLWGWTDPEDGGEYVIMGKTNGVAFFDVTDPLAPRYLGDLPNQSPGQFIWHDIKVFKDHAFITSESVNHGMTVFDLTQLRDVTDPQTFSQTAQYLVGPGSTSSFHNLAINEETGFAYLVGGNVGIAVPDPCNSGLHMVDIDDPANPTFMGCHATGEGGGTTGAASYVHDTQCVVYDGPDTDHTDREICFNSSEDHMSVVDVTDKSPLAVPGAASVLGPVQLGLAEYPETAYAHQGWLTADKRYFLMGDELDEGDTADRTRTLVFDVQDLDEPTFVGVHEGTTAAIDHNMYEKDGLMYQSNYAAGLQVLDLDGVATADLEQVASFDGFPAHDDPEFVGTWSNYPYFESGTIAFSGIDEGLFLVRMQSETPETPETPEVPGTTALRTLDSACPEGRVPDDVHGDHVGNVHDRAIDCVVWWEIAQGKTATEYQPGVPVTREQMASFVSRLVEKSGGSFPANPANAFSDDDASFHHDAINKLAAAGLVDGTGGGRYSPTAAVTRAQMAKFIVGAYEHVSDQTLARTGDAFSDDDSSTLQPFINAAAAGGFVAGRDGRYQPGMPVNRDAMASFLARPLDLLVDEGTTPAKQ